MLSSICLLSSNSFWNLWCLVTEFLYLQVIHSYWILQFLSRFDPQNIKMFYCSCLKVALWKPCTSAQAREKASNSSNGSRLIRRAMSACRKSQWETLLQLLPVPSSLGSYEQHLFPVVAHGTEKTRIWFRTYYRTTCFSWQASKPFLQTTTKPNSCKMICIDDQSHAGFSAKKRKESNKKLELKYRIHSIH